MKKFIKSIVMLLTLVGMSFNNIQAQNMPSTNTNEPSCTSIRDVTRGIVYQYCSLPIEETHIVNGLAIYLKATLSSTIHVNDATGVITSYTPVTVTINGYDASPYMVKIGAISAWGTLSSSGRTLTLHSSIDVTATTGVGTDPHNTIFNFSFNCG